MATLYIEYALGPETKRKRGKMRSVAARALAQTSLQAAKSGRSARLAVAGRARRGGFLSARCRIATTAAIFQTFFGATFRSTQTGTKQSRIQASSTPFDPSRKGQWRRVIFKIVRRVFGFLLFFNVSTVFSLPPTSSRVIMAAHCWSSFSFFFS